MSKAKFTLLPVFNDLFSLRKYLIEFLQMHPTAVQLDGSIYRQANPSASLYFLSVETKRYFQLNGDTKIVAIKQFLLAYEKHQDSCLIVNSKSKNRNRLSLHIKDELKPNGWYCYEYPGIPLSQKQAA